MHNVQSAPTLSSETKHDDRPPGAGLRAWTHGPCKLAKATPAGARPCAGIEALMMVCSIWALPQASDAFLMEQGISKTFSGAPFSKPGQHFGPPGCRAEAMVELG